MPGLAPETVTGSRYIIANSDQEAWCLWGATRGQAGLQLTLPPPKHPASSTPAGLPGPPRPGLPAHFSPNIRRAPHPQSSHPPGVVLGGGGGWCTGAEPGNADTVLQGQRDFSLPRVDLLHLPRWAGGRYKGKPPRERNPKLQTRPRPSLGGWGQGHQGGLTQAGTGPDEWVLRL